MTRYLPFLCAGVAAVGLGLASPSVAQAQAPFGLNINLGRASFSYQQGFFDPWFGGPGFGHPGFGQPGFVPVRGIPPGRFYGRPVFDTWPGHFVPRAPVFYDTWRHDTWRHPGHFAPVHPRGFYRPFPF